MVALILLTVSYLLVSSLEFSCNPFSCPTSYPGDDYCDDMCMVEVCNFDSSTAYTDNLSNLKQGDCGIMPCLSYCTEAKLKNSVCDSECNVYECGYDLGLCGFCASGCYKNMLGNGHCDAECNNLDCRYDYDDCGYCAEGCFSYMINDGTCQTQCQNDYCEYDYHDCDNNFCAQACTPEKLYNDICDGECNNLECNYDNLYCLCAPECSDEVRNSPNCDSRCNKEACGWHDGKCVNCAPGCTYEMIGDGACQTECYVEDCFNDSNDCECAPGCKLNDPEFDFCSDSCMDLRCDGHSELQNCEDIEKKLQNYYIQMIYKDFDARFEIIMCLNSDSECPSYATDEYNDNCYYDVCQTDECAYLQPYCNSNTYDLQYCNVTISEDRCLKCDFPKVQFFTDCLDECPKGYEPIAITFLDQKVCLEIQDSSSLEDSTKTYVKSTGDGDGYGSIDSPYTSLSMALLRLNDKYNTIILFEGVYDLIFHDDLENLPTHNLYYPLKREQTSKEQEPFIKITIRAATCDEYALPTDCTGARPIIRSTNLISLYTNALTFEITEVDFDGSELVCSNIDVEGCSCSLSICTYCATILNSNVLNNLIYYDDRYNQLDISGYDEGECVFGNFIFLESIPDSKIYLTSVKFSNFGLGSESLIKLKNSSLVLTNVDFENIIPGRNEDQAVIYMERTSSDPQYFKYIAGKVSMLNNGYELMSDTALSGFIISKNIDQLLIDSVTFEYNIAYQGSGSSLSSKEGYGSLIYLENPKSSVELTNLNFNYNFVNSGLIYILVNNLEFTESDYSGGVISKTNIILTSISISHTSCQNHCIFYSNISLLQNIKISNLSIMNSVSLTKSMINFKYGNALTNVEKIGGMKQIIKGSRFSKYVSARYFEISNLSATNTFFYTSFLLLENIAGIKFDTVSITSSGDFDQDINSNIVNAYTFNAFISKDLYILNGYTESVNTECENIIEINSSYAFTWTAGTFSSNNCKKVNGDTNLLIVLSSGDVIISDVLFSDILSASQYSNAIYITDHDSSLIKIYDCEFKNIDNSNGSGAVRILKVTNVEFFGNKLTDVIGTLYGGLYIEAASLTVKNCIFDNVKSRNDSGGGIAYLGNDMLSSTNFVITDSKFNRCMTPKGYGCIMIGSSFSARLLNLKMSNLKFTNSIGESSAIYIKESVSFSTALISDITVSDSSSISSGSFYIRHSKGLLTILRTSFIRNQGLNCGIFGEFAKEGELLSLENITITDNSCSVNSIYLYSKGSNNTAKLNQIFISNNSGKGLEVSKVKFTDKSSIYEKNGTGIYLSNQARGYFDTVQIRQNINIITAGGVLLESESTFTCIHCTISQNKGAEGGGLRSEQNSSFIISYSVFDSNQSVVSGSAIFILGSTLPSKLEYTEVKKNSSGKDMVISVLTGNLIINNSTIKENVSLLGNPSILSYASRITITNSTFSDQNFNSLGFLYLNSESIGLIQTSKFINLVSDGAPGALSVFASLCTVKDSEFKNIESKSNGGAILIQSKSEVYILNSRFEKVKSYNFGGVIYSQDSTLTLDNVKATEFKNSAVYGVSSYQLHIYNSEFTFGYSYLQGAAVYCSECIGTEISNSSFISNTAELKGGAIYLFGNEDEGEKNKATISNCRFYNNTASEGGAIYLTMISVDIQNCEFEENNAKSNGGGVCLECTDPSVCEYYIKDSKFSSNNAAIQGGAISWDDKKPILENLMYRDNNSTYGSDIAYYPVMIQYYVDNEAIPYQRRLETSEISPIAYKISDIVPGQKVTIELKFVVVDEYGNIDHSDNESSAEISEENVATTVLSGTKKVLAHGGMYTFKDLTIQFKPGGTTYLKVYSEAIDIQKKESSGDTIEYHDTVYIEVIFRECVIGETDLGRECKICDRGTYSLDPLNPCSDCPSEATCLGDYTMYPKSGYWRTGQFTDTFYECPNSDACLGSNNMTSYTGVCDKGYLGNLCQACDNEYSRTSENQCGTCPDAAANASRLIGIMIFMVIVCVVMVKTTFKSAYEPSSLHSIYIKIFTNYLQLVMITTQFKLEWPDLVLEVFSIQKQSGTITDQVFSVDCYLTDGSSDAYQNVYFQKLIVLALIPIILFFISFVFWGIIAQINKDRTYFKKEMIATMVILFFLVHPNITRSSFAVFSCMNIESKGYYLLDNLDIECWTGKHYLYSMSLALPCIIVWVLGTPALVLYYMHKHKFKLKEIDNKLRFGFLYNGYRNKTFYWEFVILYRKIVIISISVFLTTVSIGIQALSALLILILSLYMQMRTQPFTHKILNIMEARGILAANVTIYCGLFYLTDDLDETTKYAFFFAIVLVNFYFISYWGYYLSHEGWKIIKKRVGFFRRRFDHEDGYPEFLNEDPISKKVSVDGDQIKCTLVESTIEIKDPQACVSHTLMDLYKEYIPTPLIPVDITMDNEIISSKVNELDSFSLDITERSETFTRHLPIDSSIRATNFDFEDNEEIADESFVIKTKAF